MSTSQVTKKGWSFAYHLTDSCLHILISLTTENQDLDAIGLEEIKRLGFFKNAYRNVSYKAYFDRRTTVLKTNSPFKPIFYVIEDQSTGGQSIS